MGDIAVEVGLYTFLVNRKWLECQSARRKKIPKVGRYQRKHIHTKQINIVILKPIRITYHINP